jgi:CDP-diacylglycerol---glycerol-3-phosphate 3-phosphatidyltransferase
MSGSEPLSATVTTAPRRFWNVPNTLTVSRLVLALCVFASIANEWYYWALGIFAIAAVTDALDGYFARLLKQDTPLGRQLDPLVDKVIVSGCYIYLATNYQETGVMPWMVTAIVVRELLIQGLRSHLEGRGQAFGAKMAGKLKTVFQCLSICLVLLCLALLPSKPPILWWTRDGLTWLAVILTIYSGLSYVWIALPNFRGDT